MREFMEEINHTAAAIRELRPDVFERSFTDGIRRTVKAGWQRMRDCIDMLKLCSETNLGRLSNRLRAKWYNGDFGDADGDVETHTLDPRGMRF